MSDDEDKHAARELRRPLTDPDPEPAEDADRTPLSDPERPDKTRVKWWLKFWMLLGAVSGKRTFFLYFIFGLANAVGGTMFIAENRPYCTFLNVAVVIFQWQSLLLLVTAYDALRAPSFRRDLQNALLKLQEPEALRTLHVNMGMCLSIKAVGYITGVLVVMLPNVPQSPIRGSMSEGYTVFATVSGWLDFLRYIPVAIHVGAVRSAFETFEYSLTALKQKLKIGTSDRDEFTLIHLTCSYNEFLTHHQKLMYVFYRSSRALYGWIVCFTLFNSVIFVAYGLVLIEGSNFGDWCESTPLDFSHYGIEFISFLLLWFLFLLPLAHNHRIHERFVRDVQAMTHQDPAQMALIQNYLRSCWSPARIMGTDLSYLKLMACFYVSCGMLGYGLIQVLKNS